jgi:predicted lactoylglutathione lyase
MNITSFNPLILTKNLEETVKVFEALGFEKCHEMKDVTETGITNIDMKDANGFRLDVAGPVSAIPQDKIIIRMNVSDFDEAYEMLTARGFKSPTGGKAVEHETNKSIMLVSPSGFAFDLCQHIK